LLDDREYSTNETAGQVNIVSIQLKQVESNRFEIGIYLES